MRLQLTAVLAFISAPALGEEPAAWDGSVVTKLSSYADDDHTLITTGLAQVTVTLPAGATFGAHVLVDSISSASIDVVSSATPGFDETRIEIGGQARLVRRLGEIALAYVRSTENDWSSHSAQVTLARDFAERNTRVQVGYGFTANEVGRAGDDTFSKDLGFHTVEAGITQLVDAKTLVGVTYTLQRSDGFHSSPYRYVAVADTGAGFLETHPDHRTRHALTLRALRYVSGAGIELLYRLYGDDWGVISHTGSASATFALGKRFDLRLRGRGYYQGAARFWREQYDTPMVYMSADREASTFWDIGGGVKLGWHSGHWTVDAKIDAFLYHFLDYARLDGRAALVGDVGVGVQW